MKLMARNLLCNDYNLEASPTISVIEDSNDFEDQINGFPLLYGSRYKAIKLLGEGTTGAVFKGKDIAADYTCSNKST